MSERLTKPSTTVGDQPGTVRAEADLGVSTHNLRVETEFSFRTRVLDYQWAGLPVVTTAGVALADVSAPPPAPPCHPRTWTPSPAPWPSYSATTRLTGRAASGWSAARLRRGGE